MEKEAAGRPLTRKLIKYDRPEPVSDVCASLAEKNRRKKSGDGSHQVKANEAQTSELDVIVFNSLERYPTRCFLVFAFEVYREGADPIRFPCYRPLKSGTKVATKNWIGSSSERAKIWFDLLLIDNRINLHPSKEDRERR